MFAFTDPHSGSLFLFSQFFSLSLSLSADSMINSERERTVFILPLLINDCARDDAEDEVL